MTPRWTPRSFSPGDLSQDPHYKGGDIAFAFIGNTQLCTQNKYSMYEHNQRNANGEPWVTTLLYQSTVDPNGVYLAFEDLPMSAADWKKTGANIGAGADGDFNDYVVYVSRKSCPGDVDAACVGKQCPAGQACQLGACKDPCAGVVCTDDALCVNGACSSSPSGGSGGGGASGVPHGGTASTAAAGAGMADAGEESSMPSSSGGAGGDDEGETTLAGTDERGGAAAVMPPSSPPQKSSSCGYAALPADQVPLTWPALGIALGLAFARRRRTCAS